MCGIVGYIGKNNIKKILLDGLGELEYRGYDSAGIALMCDSDLSVFKSVGKLENLVNKMEGFESAERFGAGIGHTRWATHGKPTEVNAHPHLGQFSYVVHNGIIENYQEIKKQLLDKGHQFVSQTDTEVIVHLFEQEYGSCKDVSQAFASTIAQLKGAYAILLITQMAPDQILFAKQGSPMIIGFGKTGVYFASSDAALIDLVDSVCYLNDGDAGIASVDSVTMIGNGELRRCAFNSSRQYAQKEGFRYFMEKEIYEQSQVMAETIMGRVTESGIAFEELGDDLFSGIEEVRICACGTSYHAGLAASYLFERLGKIRARTEIASEFRYKNPVLQSSELFIVISQSGETADTLEALKMAKASGLKTLAICNVDNSSIVREADATLLTRAGIEKGVASTKAFATQMMVLWMLSLYVAQIRARVSTEELKIEMAGMLESIRAVQVESSVHERLKRLSKRYLHGHGFFFIGRDVFYPLALEGALKLKEISYLHAEGYPSGEMKHGPIALADAELFTFALMPKNLLYDKVKSNVEELSARDTTIAAISSMDFEIADDLIKIKSCDHYMVEFFAMMVIMQLLALEVSIRLGNDVDMPRNLAKSVTVE